MTDRSKPLTEEELRQLTGLLEALKGSNFDYLQLEIGDLKVTVGTSDRPAAEPRSVRSKPAAKAKDAASGTKPAAPARAASGIEIVAPMVGKFYACPEPGAAPFVSVGAAVAESSTVCLIEVMKVFTAVPAGKRGVVSEICVQDGELVEYGQVLFRLRPE